jgi:hypothetical protein
VRSMQVALIARQANVLGMGAVAGAVYGDSHEVPRERVVD